MSYSVRLKEKEYQPARIAKGIKQDQVCEALSTLPAMWWVSDKW